MTGAAGRPAGTGPPYGPPHAEERHMLAAVGAAVFAIAYLINVTSTRTDAAFTPISLLLAGLCLLALHLAGVGGGWSYSARRRRRR